MDSENGHLDVQRLIGAVAERHGILLKPDDAAFALVTMNRLVLEAAIKELLGKVENAVADFEQSAERVQSRAGSLIGNEVKNALASIRGELQSDMAAAGISSRELVLQANSRAAIVKWVALSVASALLLFLSGVVVGKILR